MARRSDHSREELRTMVMATAMRITDAGGMQSLGVRKIMREVGYTIGTFYQHYQRLDDLILELNGVTLDELYDVCSAVPRTGDSETRLLALAKAYICFTREHANRWRMLFEHRLPEGEDLPSWHRQKVLRLLAFVEAAVAQMFTPGQDAERLHIVRVMWSSIHGICSLEASNNLIQTENVEAMSETLIVNFLAGLRAN